MNFSSQIAEELRISFDRVEAVMELLADGATVPFMARYRKERTGGLDEVAITNIRDRLLQLSELDKRRTTVLSSIEEQGKLTPELKAKILKAETLAVLEDLYLPYRPKKRTRATAAKEKGLEPLAQLIFEQKNIDVNAAAEKYLDADKGVENIDEALSGARDIIAEWINENSEARQKLRAAFFQTGILRSRVVRGKEEEGSKYRDYFNWEELARTAPSHRILAIRRGEKESVLLVRILPPEEESLAILESLFVKGRGADSREVSKAAADSFKRLLSMSLETEVRLELKKKADAAAIEVFNNNLRNLLMAPPLGAKRMMAIDPGLRTGCKIVCLDEQGKLLDHDAVYLVGSEAQQMDAVDVIKAFVKKHGIEVIAVGNGTASRETETFLKNIGLSKDISIVIASESGASIYSASEVAREEFGAYDLTVRGAVSIGRRLMDPLAELVKIDPKSIGVGQYQHDVDQNLLKKSLDDVVISCVNQVGVELNTASKQLLTYVSGVGPTRAQAIIDYRDANGPFKQRAELTRVSGFGPKAFEQAAGFLRIRGASNPLDASAVHPESYPIVERMAHDLDASVNDLAQNAQLRQKIRPKDYVTDTIGLPTLMDIISELEKPGRDPRPPFELFTYKEGISRLEDLTEGMKLPGVVTNVTAFGAFVDIGVHQDGLVHISQLSDRYIKDANEVVKVHQKVMVTVLEIDNARKRIALSMKKNP